MVLCKVNSAINSTCAEVQCEPISYFDYSSVCASEGAPPVLPVLGSSVRSWLLVYVAL